MTVPPGSVVLGVDFGTSNTVAALAVPGRSPRILSIDGSSWLPSAVFAADDGALAVGRDAERRARLAPERFEPNPKRRIDDGEMLLGNIVVSVTDAISAVLRRVAEEAQRQLSGRRPQVAVLSHPAGWGSTRRSVLQAAARQAGLADRLLLVPEPVAAAVHFGSLQDAGESGAPGGDPPGHGSAAGRPLAVYDLGGGTFDCAVVTMVDGRYAVAADDGLVDVGGVDFDQAVLDHLGRTASAAGPNEWRNLLRPQSSADRRAARAIAEDVRSAKETLSRYSQAEVPLPQPLQDAMISKVEFEGLIRPMVIRTVDVLARTIERAGVAPRDLAGIYLVGGSSRIPLVGTEIAERIGVVPTTLDQPEATVALGAALWATEQDARPAAAGAVPGMALPGMAMPGTQEPTRSTPGQPPSGPGSVPFSSAPPGSGRQHWRSGGPGSGPIRPAVSTGPGTPRKSRRGTVIAVAAAVVVIAVASVIVVIATRNSSTAGPPGPSDPTTGRSTGGTSATLSTSGAGSSTSGGSGSVTSGSSTGSVDPTKCPVDEVDAQGLTRCMRVFAGGLVSGARCTKDAKELGLTQEEVDYFGAFNSQWQACFAKDQKTVALLFQNTGPAARNAIWRAFVPDQVAPKTCGNYVGGESRGAYVFGTSTDDNEPVVIWEDTALPLLGVLRPPESAGTLQAKDLRSYFASSSGLALTDGDCSKVLADTGATGAVQTSGGGSTSSSQTVNESTVRPDDPTKCVATPLDKNNMSPCLLMLAGNGPALNPTCFTGSSLDQFKDLGDVAPAVVAACVYQPQLLTATVIYLQFADQAKADKVFAALTKSAKGSAWEQAGRRGTVVDQLAEDGRTATVTWNFTDMPVVIYAQGEGSSGATVEGDSLTQAMNVFWKSLLPTNG